MGFYVPTIERVNILGVGVSAIHLAQAVQIIEAWMARAERHYVCITNTFNIMECQRHADLRRLYNRAGLVTPDGMPLVWLMRLAGRRDVGRVYGPDLMLALCACSAAQPYRHYFYGGTSAVMEALQANLRRQFPTLDIVGHATPPFRPLTAEEDAQITDAINASHADIVWVGLGSTKQERWMVEHRERLTAPVLIGVGAAFDFLSGRKPQAPRWIRNRGFEWLFRLASEPRRLWRRYLINAPLFVLLVALQKLGLRHYALNDDPE